MKHRVHPKSCDWPNWDGFCGFEVIELSGDRRLASTFVMGTVLTGTVAMGKQGGWVHSTSSFAAECSAGEGSGDDLMLCVEYRKVHRQARVLRYAMHPTCSPP